MDDTGDTNCLIVVIVTDKNYTVNICDAQIKLAINMTVSFSYSINTEVNVIRLPVCNFWIKVMLKQSNST